ncbi:MAG: hypothetical protein IT433_12900 [Phycisphaerales bacterium]|nr:hypothetical protein [Phycisphaerales bacterium]
MFMPLISILRSPEADGGGGAPAAPESAAPAQTNTTETSGEATSVQGAGASAGESSTPEPSTDPLDDAVSRARAAMSKADGTEQEPSAPTADTLTDEQVDAIVAEMDAEAKAAQAAASQEPKAEATAKAPDAPKPESKPDAKAAAKPEAKPDDKAADKDIKAIVAERFPGLVDFDETHDLVRSLVEMEAKLAEATKRDMTPQVAEIVQAQRRVDAIHQAINSIPDLDREMFGEYGRRMGPKQMEKRVALDTLAARIYKQLEAESNLSNLTGIEREEAVYTLSNKALDAAHRSMTKKRSRPSAETEAIGKLRQTASQRSPAALGSGRTQVSTQINDDDDGPTAIRKVLAAHGIGKN